MRIVNMVLKLIFIKCDINRLSLSELVRVLKVLVRSVQHWFEPVLCRYQFFNISTFVYPLDKDFYFYFFSNFKYLGRISTYLNIKKNKIHLPIMLGAKKKIGFFATSLYIYIYICDKVGLWRDLWKCVPRTV